MTNVGTFDRTLRFILGAVLLAGPFLPLFAPLGAWRLAPVAAGVVMIATAVFRFCPAYILPGIRTWPIARS